MSSVKDIHAYLTEAHGIWRLVVAAVLIVLGWLTTTVAGRLVSRAFRRLYADAETQRARRIEVLSGLITRGIRYLGFFFTADVVLLVMGVPLGGFSLTSLGIASVALGIAVQPLVREAVSGFFIILEGQYGVGDYVTIAGITGIVQDVSVRRTLLRGLGGESYTIPHSLVDKTVNLSRGSSQALVDIKVNYLDDLNRVISTLEQVCQVVARERQDLLGEPPKVLGVTDLGENAITVRLIAKTLPLQQWTVERELRRAVRLTFAREGFRPPTDAS